MSRIGKKPVAIKDDVSVTKVDKEFVIKGPKGEVKIKDLPYLKAVIGDKEIEVNLEKNIKQGRSNWGTLRSLLEGAIRGVTDGYEKELEVNGVGFRAAMEGKTLVLNLGFSHPIRYEVPKEITVEVDKNNIKVSGFNKDLVGRTAAKIRAFKKPEPYKGKGIKYKDEIIIRKDGKKVVG